MSSRITRTAPIVPAYQEGQVIQVTTVDVAHGGWCVARPDDGPVVFVRHALPGETVRARITEVTSRLARAEAVEILAASPDRRRQIESGFPARSHARKIPAAGPPPAPRIRSSGTSPRGCRFRVRCRRVFAAVLPALRRWVVRSVARRRRSQAQAGRTVLQGPKSRGISDPIALHYCYHELALDGGNPASHCR